MSTFTDGEPASIEWRLQCNLCRCQQTTEPMSEGLKVKGHLIITVAEASGKNKDDQLVWDPNFVEGFVKGESTSALSMGTA